MNPNSRREQMNDVEELLRALAEEDEMVGDESVGDPEGGDEPLKPQEREAALGAVRSAVVDGQLEAASRQVGPPAPSEELVRYLERVRETAGIPLDRWAVRLGVASDVLERVITTRRGALLLRPESWAAVLSSLNLPVEALRQVIAGAAALLGGSVARSAESGDPRVEATVREFMQQVETALRNQDRDDLIA